MMATPGTITSNTATTDADTSKNPLANDPKQRLTMSAEEAAAEIGCSMPTMYALLNSSGFDAGFRLGTKWRVSCEKLEQWILRQTEKAR
jgi:excisionase family DNA binding protein